MTRSDILDTPVGEMLDYLSCFYIVNGVAVEVKKRRTMDYDEVMALG